MQAAHEDRKAAIDALLAAELEEESEEEDEEGEDSPEDVPTRSGSAADLPSPRTESAADVSGAAKEAAAAKELAPVPVVAVTPTPRKAQTQGERLVGRCGTAGGATHAPATTSFPPPSSVPFPPRILDIRLVQDTLKKILAQRAAAAGKGKRAPPSPPRPPKSAKPRVASWKSGLQVGVG